jgi:hypothetical protein
LPFELNHFNPRICVQLKPSFISNISDWAGRKYNVPIQSVTILKIIDSIQAIVLLSRLTKMSGRQAYGRTKLHPSSCNRSKPR